MSAKKINVILLENLKGYGNKGTIIQVSAPYALNYLIPKGLAKIADSKTINEESQRKIAQEKHHNELLKSIENMLEDINLGGGLVISMQATPMGHLYDKIDANDIAKHIFMKYKIKLQPSNFKLSHKIDMLGQYPVEFSFENIKRNFDIVVVKK